MLLLKSLEFQLLNSQTTGLTDRKHVEASVAQKSLK